MIAARVHDGAFDPTDAWTAGTTPGVWRPTPPTNASDGAWVGSMRSFVIALVRDPAQRHVPHRGAARADQPAVRPASRRALDEVVEARIWAGVHFRSADEQGVRIGNGVARYVLSHEFGRR
jgi:hypothetical protein